MVYPTQEVKDGAEIDLGDRILRFTAHGAARTTSDLSMLDARTGILFPADLLFVTRVPSLDGSLLGWLKEADKLAALGAAAGRAGSRPGNRGLRARPGGPDALPFDPARRNPQGRGGRACAIEDAAQTVGRIRARQLGLVRRL